MISYAAAVILGIVEGLTEFLPVSSTGHLILASSLMGLSGEKVASFEIAIQLGAILAVVALYWERFTLLLKNDPVRRFSGIRGLWFLALTSMPASVVGLIAHSYIKEHLFTPRTVAMALGAGALAILLVEGWRKRPRTETIDQMSWKLALGVGCFQCLALWPGFSRSAATIMGGMIMGATRTVAAEYSFIAAVPIMIAATGYDLLSSASLFTAGDFIVLGIGFAVSFISAWAAVKVFIRLLGAVTLRPFAYYRLILCPLILFYWPG